MHKQQANQLRKKSPQTMQQSKIFSFSTDKVEAVGLLTTKLQQCIDDLHPGFTVHSADILSPYTGITTHFIVLPSSSFATLREKMHYRFVSSIIQ